MHTQTHMREQLAVAEKILAGHGGQRSVHSVAQILLSRQYSHADAAASVPGTLLAFEHEKGAG